MTMSQISRLCEVLEKSHKTTHQTNLIIQAAKKTDLLSLLRLLNNDLLPNNMGVKKTKGWVCRHFSIFDDELDGEDLASSVYALDFSREKTQDYSIEQITRIIEMDSNLHGAYELFSEVLGSLSSLERKWFIRFYTGKVKLMLPMKKITNKVLSKVFDKELKTVELDSKMNSLSVLISAYERNVSPSNNVVAGIFVPPMICSIADKKSNYEKVWEDSDHVCEYKYDGVRVQVHKNNNSVIIFSRNGKNITATLPEIVSIIREYPDDELILDGEVYCVDRYGKPDTAYGALSLIQGDKSRSALLTPRWVWFDCLRASQDSMLEHPYLQRIKAVEHLPDRVIISKINEPPLAVYNRAITDGYEGIVIKRLDSQYQPRTTTHDWLKHKPPRINLDVVILSSMPDKSNSLSSLEIGVKSGANFTSLGTVAGLPRTEQRMLERELRTIVDSFSDGRYYFLPRIVLEVEAEMIMLKDNKYTLRLAKIKAIRRDKYVSDISTKKMVDSLIGGN